MQDRQEPANTRGELLDRLRNLEDAQSQGTLAELAYRRAREALERALEEAAQIRLQALGDARSAREREMVLVMESLKAMRQSAEVQVQSVLAAAEIEAEQLRERARHDARDLVEDARREAEAVTAEAAAVRQAAEARAREIEQLEADFDALVSRFADRLGISEKPEKGWWSRLFR